jgi:hypothetical protein
MVLLLVVTSYLPFIAYYPFKEKKKWARNAIMTAFGIWLIITLVFVFILVFMLRYIYYQF